MKLKITLLLLLICCSEAIAKSYDLEVSKKEFLGIDAMAINNSIPAPTLYFQEGDDAEIKVKNSLGEPTSIHWHGILLEGSMDGVPGLNGFKAIAPGETFTYKFKIRQSGTYWYHSHSNLQEQQGLYGSIVVQPKKQHYKANRDYANRDYVIVLSDFSSENPNKILNNLKMDSGYYNYGKRTVFTFFSDVKKDGFWPMLKDYLSWGEMRMDPTDLADVTNYKFLFNGKTSDEKSTLIFKKGEPVKLRFINAAAMTIFDISIPGLKLNFVEADGQPIKKVSADEFRLGVAETYDVIVEPQEDKAYTIFAESLDRTGYALGILAPQEGLDFTIPKMRPRAQLTMSDMNMEGMDHGDMDHSNMSEVDMRNMESGWQQRGTKEGKVALEYADLKSLYPQKDLRKPSREIEFKFGGSMNRYIWTINGEQFPKPFKVKFGEKVRLKFVNETMMAHPIHLHGMFMQMENGQKAKWLPNKHTVIVPPAQSVSMLLTANEAGEWAFHCHLLYHMASGMMTSVTVENSEGE